MVARVQRKTKLPNGQRLPLKVKTALADFQRRVLELFPNDIQAITLYGSYARGEAVQDSDVDVLLVVKWTEEQSPDGEYLAWFGDPRWNRIIDIATDVLLDRGVYISPHVVSAIRFAHGKDTLLTAIRREGKTLWPKTKTTPKIRQI